MAVVRKLDGGAWFWVCKTSRDADLTQVMSVPESPGLFRVHGGRAQKSTRLLLQIPHLANGPASSRNLRLTISLATKRPAAQGNTAGPVVDWIALVSGPSPGNVTFWRQLKTHPSVAGKAKTFSWTVDLDSFDPKLGDLYLGAQFAPNAPPIDISMAFAASASAEAELPGSRSAKAEQRKSESPKAETPKGESAKAVPPPNGKASGGAVPAQKPEARTELKPELKAPAAPPKSPEHSITPAEQRGRIVPLSPVLTAAFTSLADARAARMELRANGAGAAPVLVLDTAPCEQAVMLIQEFPGLGARYRSLPPGTALPLRLTVQIEMDKPKGSATVVAPGLLLTAGRPPLAASRYMVPLDQAELDPARTPLAADLRMHGEIPQDADVFACLRIAPNSLVRLGEIGAEWPAALPPPPAAPTPQPAPVAIAAAGEGSDALVKAMGSQLARSLLRLRAPKIAVLLPLVNPKPDVLEIVNWLGRDRSGRIKLMLFVDPEASARLQSSPGAFRGNANVIMVPLPANAGHDKLLRLGSEGAGTYDVILLPPDAAISPRTLLRLMLAAHSGPDVAIATLCAGRPDAAGPASALATMNEAIYLRRDAMDQVGPFHFTKAKTYGGAIGQWTQRALQLGWRDATVELAPPQPVSHAASAVAARPIRTLFVINSRTGGTPQTNADLMAALGSRYDTLVLQSDRRKLSLLRFHDRTETLLETHVLSEPIGIKTHRSDEYDAVVGNWLLRYEIDLLHVRHLALHSLGLLQAARDLLIPTVLSFHDFYVVCPTVKLLDASLTYCGGVCLPGTQDCRPDLWPKDSAPPLRDRWVHQWRDMMRVILRACDGFVASSASAHQVLLATFPELAGRKFSIIRHGRDFDMGRPGLAASPKPGAPLRILLLGNTSKAKGARLIKALLALDTAGKLEIHVAGEVDGSLAGTRAILHGAYRRDEVGAIIEKVRPHLGGVFSIWPETYCHTLTELWAHGIPVVAFNLGAVGERIAETQGGWLMEDQAPEAVLRFLLDEAARPEGHKERVAAVERWRQGEGRSYGTAAMAAQYDALYASVLDEGRSLFPVDPLDAPAAATGKGGRAGEER